MLMQDESCGGYFNCDDDDVGDEHVIGDDT